MSEVDVTYRTFNINNTQVYLELMLSFIDTVLFSNGLIPKQLNDILVVVEKENTTEATINLKTKLKQGKIIKLYENITNFIKSLEPLVKYCSSLVIVIGSSITIPLKIFELNFLNNLKDVENSEYLKQEKMRAIKRKLVQNIMNLVQYDEHLMNNRIHFLLKISNEESLVDLYKESYQMKPNYDLHKYKTTKRKMTFDTVNIKNSIAENVNDNAEVHSSSSSNSDDNNIWIEFKTKINGIGQEKIDL